MSRALIEVYKVQLQSSNYRQNLIVYASARDRRLVLSVVVETGPSDVPLILDEIPAGWDDMGNADNGNATKDPEEITVDSLAQKKEVAENDAKPEEEEAPKTRCVSCMKTLFVILGVLSVIVAIALIIVTILTSIATRAYDADQSSRIAAMVLLAVTAAVTICMVIYLEVATFKKHTKPMLGTAVVILILAIVQALIGGISVNVQPADEAKLLKSLADSFRLAREDVARHYKLWSMTQYDLSCCGVYGPEDYRTQKQPYYFPPDVPVSCCPAYDPDRSDLVQERERELCKAKKSYYSAGCKDLVLLVFNETATIVLTVTVILIVVEIFLLIIGAVLSRQLSNQNNQVSPK